MSSRNGLYLPQAPLLVAPNGVAIDWRGASPVELDYVTVSALQTISAVTEGTQQVIVQGNKRAFDGKTQVRLEFWCGKVGFLNGGFWLRFWHDASATDLGGAVYSTALSNNNRTVFLSRHYTPPAGTSSFSLRAWASSGSGQTLGSTADGYLPMFLRVAAN